MDLSKPKEIHVYLISGGRESLAMTIKEIKKNPDFFDRKDVVGLFADTLDDPLGKETNDYMKKYHNWKIHTVYSKYGNIREYYENKEVDNEPDHPEYIGHALPSQANKDCSQKFKIIPECKWLFETFGKDCIYHLYFGFDFSKKDISRFTRMQTRLAKTKIKQIPHAPLIEQQLTRSDCGKICNDYMGWIPERSQCVMCFERTISDWKHAFKIMPRAISRIIKFEESSKLFKKFGYGLSAKPIRKILRIPDKQQTTLDIKPCPCVEDFDMDICLTSDAV